VGCAYSRIGILAPGPVTADLPLVARRRVYRSVYLRALSRRRQAVHASRLTTLWTFQEPPSYIVNATLTLFRTTESIWLRNPPRPAGSLRDRCQHGRMAIGCTASFRVYGPPSALVPQHAAERSTLF
jgi:hypothetical protein